MNAVTPINAEVAGLGHNSPPVEPGPFGAIKAHIDDLLVEARAWADGTTVETQEQADEASRLIDDLRKAGDAADAVRIEEKAPLDVQVEEIQTRYNAYIAGLKTKNANPGKVTRAIDALKATVKPFLDKLEAERHAAARKAREEAEAAAKAAADAVRAAQASDLAAQEAAEDVVRAAAKAEAAAKQIENSRVQARGGARAMGLRTSYIATLTDPRAALVHYASRQPDALKAFLQSLADTDVRAGVRTLPGFEITPQTTL